VNIPTGLKTRENLNGLTVFHLSQLFIKLQYHCRVKLNYLNIQTLEAEIMKLSQSMFPLGYRRI